MRGPQQLAALAELDDEFENVRGAWEWALQNRQWKWLRTSLAALSFFITARSRFLEAITLLQHVLDAVAAVENSPEGTAEGQGLAAWALTLQSCFFGWLSQFDKQVNGLERSRAAVHQYGTPYEIVSHCCFYASTRAHPEEARSLYEQALAILWAVGVTWEVGFVINSMGHFALS